jgi:Leucine-rich repeat (LRR) protein
MYKSSNLRWIDLSHNLIEIIDYDFNDFENLQVNLI